MKLSILQRNAYGTEEAKVDLDRGGVGLLAYAPPPPTHSFFYCTDTCLQAKIQTLYLKRMDPELQVWVSGRGGSFLP